MSEHLVGRAWLTDVESTAQRALLGSIAWLSDCDGRTHTTTAAVARAAGMSTRSAHDHLAELVAAGWIQIEHVRSADGRRHGGSQIQLSPRFLPKDPHPAIVAASRKPPSVTMPAPPRTISRVTRISPAEAALASLRLSITITWPGGQVSMATRCGWAGLRNSTSWLRSSRAGMYLRVKAGPTIFVPL